MIIPSNTTDALGAVTAQPFNGTGTYSLSAALSGTLTQPVFNTVLPTLTNGQNGVLQVDSSSRLITNPTPVAGLDPNTALTVSPAAAATPLLPATVNGSSAVSYTTTAGSNNTVVWTPAGSRTNRRVKISNNSSGPIYLSYFSPASLGSFLINAGERYIEDTLANTLYIWTPAIVVINGTVAGGVFIEGGV